MSLNSRENRPNKYVMMVVEPSENGGYTATSEVFPEIVTEGGDLMELMKNFQDALSAVMESYEKEKKPLPL